MAGSLKWFSYTTDVGDVFGVFADESNAELAGTGVDLTGQASALYALPRNVQPRFARYQDASGTIVRKALISVQGTAPTTPIIDPGSGASLDLTAIVGEKVRILTGVDTGIIDGDLS